MRQALLQQLVRRVGHVAQQLAGLLVALPHVAGGGKEEDKLDILGERSALMISKGMDCLLVAGLGKEEMEIIYLDNI